MILRGVESVCHFEPLSSLGRSGTDRTWGGVGEPLPADGDSVPDTVPSVLSRSALLASHHQCEVGMVMTPFMDEETEAWGSVS